MEKEKNIYEILTRREIEITTLIVNGLTDKDIAEKLDRSFHTIRSHHKNILRKTSQKNISGLINFARNNGLISQEK